MNNTTSHGLHEACLSVIAEIATYNTIHTLPYIQSVPLLFLYAKLYFVYSPHPNVYSFQMFLSDLLFNILSFCDLSSTSGSQVSCELCAAFIVNVDCLHQNRHIH